MHTIFITVAEFLENGGKLNYGRSFYGAPNGQEIGYYVPENDHTFEGHTVVTRSTGYFPMDNNSLYLEIDCTPIYK